MTVREMKKTFKCGGCLIQQVRKAIREKKPLKVPGHKHINPIRDDPSLVGLVDTITGDNGAVSDADLANLLGTSRSSVNRIRQDLKFSYRPLRHGPLLQDSQIDARLAFCRAHLNDDWSTTMFTDESSFATSPDCPVKSWTKRGQNAFIESQKFPASFMVLGWHCREQKGSIAQVSQQNGFRWLHPAAGGERHRGVFKGKRRCLVSTRWSNLSHVTKNEAVV